MYQVLSVLKRISDEDCQLLGFNPKYARPDWMILQVLPIPPPPVRPSVMMDTSSRSEVNVLLLFASLLISFGAFIGIFYPIAFEFMILFPTHDVELFIFFSCPTEYRMI